MAAKKVAKEPKHDVVVPEAAAVAEVVEAKETKPVIHKQRYVSSIGRRKTSQAKIKLWAEGTGEFTVNQRTLEHYFPTLQLQKFATEPLSVMGLLKKVNVVVITRGGGVNSQSQAVGLGIARALLGLDPNMRATMRKSGFLTRDARKKERKKPGLKRARRAPQWQKR